MLNAVALGAVLDVPCLYCQVHALLIENLLNEDALQKAEKSMPDDDLHFVHFWYGKMKLL